MAAKAAKAPPFVPAAQRIRPGVPYPQGPRRTPPAGKRSPSAAAGAGAGAGETAKPSAARERANVAFRQPELTPNDTRRRVRMHVNPLQSFYLQEVPIPDWSTTFASPSSPLHFDIGFGKGLYLFRLARDNRDWNFVGIDIRLPMVQSALAIQQSSGLKNLHFMWGNANINFTRIAQSFPKDTLQRISLLYPDPWFKKRHLKRRILTPQLVSEIANVLKPGGQMLIETDVKELADDMWSLMAVPAFAEITDPKAPFAALDVSTERQVAVKRTGVPAFKKLFERTHVPLDSDVLLPQVGPAQPVAPAVGGSDSKATS